MFPRMATKYEESLVQLSEQKPPSVPKATPELPKDIIHRETEIVPQHPKPSVRLHPIFLEIRDWRITALSALSKELHYIRHSSSISSFEAKISIVNPTCNEAAQFKKGWYLPRAVIPCRVRHYSSAGSLHTHENGISEEQKGRKKEISDTVTVLTTTTQLLNPKRSSSPRAKGTGEQPMHC